MNFKTKKIRKNNIEESFYDKNKANPNRFAKDEEEFQEFAEEEFAEEEFTESNSLPATDTSKKNPSQTKKIFFLRISIGTFALVLILLLTGIYYTVKSMDIKHFLSIAGTDLLTDEYGHTNFLLLGNGGKNHEGGDLTDTILIASLDNENKIINMVSIPRDLYVKDEKIGNSKINEVYYYAKEHYANDINGLMHFKGIVEEIIGTEIQYWAMIDFEGFKQIVDILGGVEIDVKKAIYDPYYPKDGTYLYEPFSISAGLQHFDGETALKYVRSRKTTSDFDRSERQQETLFALKEKALETKILFNREKLTEILDALKSNIHTNIKIKELLTLGAIAGDYSKERINQKLIHDDPNSCGGFLYTPAREYYGGMFVLIPAGGMSFLHKYIEMIFNYPLISLENPKIHVLNGTPSAGIAGENKQILKRFCFDVTRFGNASSKTVEETTYYYKQKYNEENEPIESRPLALNFLQTIIPGKESTQIPQEYEEYTQNADILLEIGKDYVSSTNYLKDPFYSLQAYYSPPKQTATETTEANDTNTESVVTTSETSE